MKFLLLNQTFHPDVVSTAQHLKDLALTLAQKGHVVTVITSGRAYDRPDQRFPVRESWRGVDILRVNSLGLGKSAKWRRAADFASFFLTATFKALRLPRHDVVIALTSPPLISALGAFLARRWRASFYYWIMDLNPDEAIAAGWLKPQSIASRALDRISRYSLQKSRRVIVLDRFMKQRVEVKGIPSSNIEVIPPWSHDNEVRFDAPARDAFRVRHRLQNKFVVMYSGNHSPCHPLDTLLKAALESATLADSSEASSPPIHFCFVGGGSQFAKVKAFAAQNHLENVLCLPYQPLSELAGSLSAADLHVVVMGDNFVGTIHPCKIYNILRICSPVLYVGPQPSHVSEILHSLDPKCAAMVAHGDVEGVLKQIIRLRKISSPNRDAENFSVMAKRFSQRVILPQMIDVVEGQSINQPITHIMRRLP